MQPPVVLVILAWDEAESIGALLSEVPPEQVGEVVVVVGSSADPIAAVAAAHGARIVAQSRPGYGAACWQGAREAAALGAKIVVFLDGDYADPPMELAQVMGPVLADEADLVLGCRNVSAHPGALPLHARFGNRLVLTALRVLLGGSGLFGPLTQVSIQSGAGLGDALDGAFREGVADGLGAVAVVGADSPTLPALVIREAFAALTDNNDVALGPAEDGGYYLLAARRLYPWLFRDMPWSTDGVASDAAASLAILRMDLRRLPASTEPHTRAALEALHDVTMRPGRAA